MVRGKRKLDKKTKLKRLKAFANGEDLSEVLALEAPVKIIFRTVGSKEGGPSWSDGEPISWGKGRVIILEPQEGNDPLTEFPSSMPANYLVWKEEKTYPDPEIPGVSYSNPANVPEAQNSDDKTNVIESSGQTENPKESQKKPSRKQFLQQRLMEFAEQERIDLEIKSKEDFWIYANRSF